MIPNRKNAEVNDPRPVNLKTFAVFGEVCLATGTVVHGVPTSPTLGSGEGIPTHERPNGSVFLRTDGATGSTVYSMIAGVWVPIDSGGTSVSAQYLDDLLGHTLTAEDGELNTGARHDQNTDQYLDEGGINQSTAADVADAVTLKHTQGTDQGLDTGGPSATTAAEVKDAVDKAHTQNTDQYLDEGGLNQSTAADVADAVTLKHDQDTDQYLDFGGLNQVSAADVKTAVDDSHVQGTDQYLDEGGLNQSTAADVKDAVDKAHDQGTDQGLDTGGPNASTAADVADAVSLKHTQNSDTYLDEGGANEVTAANAASAVSLKHDRSHALDDTSDHTIGSGAEGQVIGVSGGALGWITPGGGGGGEIVAYDFPSSGVKNWVADGAGTEGLWTCSGNPTDFNSLSFVGGDLNIAINNSSGVEKSAMFTLDLSAYENLGMMPATQVGMNITQFLAATAAGTGWYIQTELSDTVSLEYLRTVYWQTVANKSMQVHYAGSGATVTASAVDGAFATGVPYKLMAAKSHGARLASGLCSHGVTQLSATTAATTFQSKTANPLVLRVQAVVATGCNMGLQISDVFAGPLFPV